jgi:hypothetical protein
MIPVRSQYALAELNSCSRASFLVALAEMFGRLRAIGETEAVQSVDQRPVS